MAAIVALFGAVGAALGGAQGMLVALAFGVATNLAAYWFSDKMVLRMYNARAGRRDERAAVLRHGPRAGREGGPADAARLPDRRSPAQRVRDRAQSRARGGRRDHGAAPRPHRAGARRRDGARARAREASRHPDLDDHRVGCRRDLDARELRHVLRRSRRRAPQPGVRAADPDRRADRGDADPVRDLALARVRGRPRRRGDLGRPEGARRCAGQDRPLRAGDCRSRPRRRIPRPRR